MFYSFTLVLTAEDKTLHRQSVSSSRIHSIGYDPEKRVLEIQFHKKGTYQYIDVPERIYKDFISTTVLSKGRFFDGVIKDKFLCRKMD